MKNETSTFGNSIRPTDAGTADKGQVRLGGTAPSFPVRRPAVAVADSGKVRMGGTAPWFPKQ
jgi:hypothetical protein